MALCAQLPNSVAWKQQRQPIYICWQPPKPTCCSTQKMTVARRGFLFSIFFAVAAPSPHGSSWANQPKEVQPKEVHVPIEKIKDIIENDIKNKQYYVTGDLTQAIYEDNCRFVDPTGDIQGIDKYVAAIKLLFDPKSSRHELTSIDLVDPSTIQVRWKLEGYLKLPWHPHIEPYEGTTIYHVNDKGLIASHEETWDISFWTAFREFLTPSWK